MSYYAHPPQELPATRTAAQLRWAESRRRHGAEVARLLADSDALRAFVVRCRLRAGAEPLPADRCEESHLTAGGVGSADASGPANR